MTHNPAPVAIFATAVMPPDLPERLRAVGRVATTRFGRWRHSVTWLAR